MSHKYNDKKATASCRTLYLATKQPKQLNAIKKAKKDIYIEKGLSVIIPAYNESLRIIKTVRSIRLYLENKAVPHEIIVVDDGSKDHTSEHVEKESHIHPSLILVRNAANSGKGAAIRTGIAYAKYGLILISDADLSAPIENIEAMRSYMESGYDIAIGSRSIPGSILPVKQPLHRRIMGNIFRIIVKLIVLEGFKDTQCGFKMLTSPAAKKIFNSMTTNGFAYDVEMLLIGRKLGFSIAEVPIVWSDSPHSKIKPITDSIKMFSDLLTIRKKHRKTTPVTNNSRIPLCSDESKK